jgi:PAS domain S-box-containing protein
MQRYLEPHRVAGTTVPADAAELVSELNVGVGVLREGKWVWVNRALGSLVGSTPEALIGSDFADLLSPEERTRIQERYRVRQLGEHAPSSYELIAVRADGQPVRLEIEPKKISESEMLVLVRDLGERVRDRALLGALSELALKVQRARSTEAVISISTEGLAGLGFSTCILRVEPELARVLAVTMPQPHLKQLETLIGGPLTTLSFPAPVLAPMLQAVSAQGFGFFDDLTPFLADAFTFRGLKSPPDLGGWTRALGVEKVAISPLVVNEQTWGALYIASSNLRSNDAAALALFSAQVATAIEVASSIEDLRRRNAQLEAIHRVDMAGTDQRLEVLTPALLKIACEATESDAASLYVLDSDQRALILAGEIGANAGLLEKYRRIPVDEGPEAHLLSQPGPRRLTPEMCTGAGQAEAMSEGFLESAVIPLRVGGQFAGILNLSRKSARAFTDEELQSTELLAGQIAAQVERARLHGDAQRRLEELSLVNEVGSLIANNLELEQVLDTAMRHVARIVDVPEAFLMLVEPGGRELLLHATNVPLPEGTTFRMSLRQPSAAARSLAEGHPVVVEDVDSNPRRPDPLATRFGHRAILAVPLLSKGDPVGALVLGETGGHRRFTRSEIDRAVAMANQLAAAIDNARLYDAQRQRVEQLRLLLDMGRVITGSLELEPILREAAQALVRMIGATDAYIWFLDGTELCGRLCSAPEHNADFAEVRRSLGAPSAAAMAIQLRAPVRIEDAMGSPEVASELARRYGQRSLMAIPLMLRDIPIGAIAVGDRRQPRCFTEDEVERALLISRQLAVAIDNARLFEDLKRSYHELSRAQQELVRRERLAALGELSAVVAHEVRNPLGVIFNSLASLKRMLPPDEDARMLLGIVGEEAERLNRMVGDLLDFARPNEPQLRPESLSDVIGGALHSAQRAMGSCPVTIRLQVPDDLPLVPMDAHMVRQAVLNLVGNALQAMPNGGTLTVRAAEERRGGARFARLEVEDDGPGIPPDLADRVFQPFFTTRAAGTGLGLAVVKRIADAHRAELTLRPTPGGGATFTLRLPM